MIGEQRQFILQVIAETLGEFRDDKAGIIDLPNPIGRRLQ